MIVTVDILIKKIYCICCHTCIVSTFGVNYTFYVFVILLFLPHLEHLMAEHADELMLSASVAHLELEVSVQ